MMNREILVSLLIVSVFFILVVSGESVSAAPAAIADLAVSNPMPNSVDLSWTAPVNNGDYENLEYDVRYSTSPIITESDWDSALMTTGEPNVSAAGTAHSMFVTFLEPDTTYYFAIKTREFTPFGSGIGMSYSGLSNVVSTTTSARQGNVYYVSQADGDDSYNGLYDSYQGGSNGPWLTIQKAASTMTAGDIVYIRSGTYTEEGLTEPVHAQYYSGIGPENSGTAGNNIVFTSYPGDNPIIDPEQNNNGFLCNTHNYIVFDSLKIRNAYFSGIYIRYSNYTMVKNCIIWDTWAGTDDHLASGVFTGGNHENEGGFYNIYRNNTVWGSRDPSFTDNCFGLLFYSCTYHLVDGNDCFDNAMGIDIKNLNNHVEICGNIVRDQRIGISIGMRTDYNLIYENLAYNNEQAGIVITYNNGAGESCDYNRIWSNTIYNCGEEPYRVAGICFDGTSTYTQMWNNIASKVDHLYGALHLEKGNDPCYPLESDYNDLHNPDGTTVVSKRLTSTTHYTLPEWQAYCQTEPTRFPSVYDLNSISADPLFVDPENGDFRLQETSPCKGTGYGGVDMGAYPSPQPADCSDGIDPGELACYVTCHCPDGMCDCTVDTIPTLSRPPKGELIIDPNFHTTITRITDADNDLGLSDAKMRINYPKFDISNSDGSMILITGTGGSSWHLYNANTFEYIKSLNPSFVGWGGSIEQRWDADEPNIFYYRRYATLYKYTIGDPDTNEVVHDFTDEYPGATSIANGEEGDCSRDNRYWAFVVSTGEVIVYDKETDTIIGEKTGLSGIDWVSMTPSGDRVVARLSGGIIRSWNRDFTGEVTIPAGAGHADLGADADGNDVVIYFADSGGNDWINFADVETGVETPLIDWNPLYGFNGCHNSGGHISGIDNPGMGGWAVIGTQGSYQDATCWPDQSIYLVELKENPRVWRIAHHHSYYNGYGDYPAATINRAGTKIFFNSNWDGNVYLNDLDVYQVELPATWWTDLGGTVPQCSGTCKPNPCNTYENCNSLPGTCASGYCCQGLCTPDTTPPSIITGPTASSITTSSATVMWTTDEESNSLVRYGTGPGSYPNLKSDPSYVTSHSIQLTGLTADTDYYYIVESADMTGNPAQSSEYSFTTSQIPSGTLTETWGDVAGSDHPGTVEDTFIDSGTANSNYATDMHIKTYTWPANTIANAIAIKWDLTAIPDSATIVNATLYLYMDSMSGDGGDNLYDISAHKIINANPTILTCTWNTPWTTPGAQDDITPAEDTKPIDKTYGYKPWLVTNMVQDWVKDPTTNYGMLINSDAAASSDSNRFFASSENSDSTRRPRLIITYSMCHKADGDCDGCIIMGELLVFIDKWKMDSTNYPMSELMEAIGLWKQGTGCG
jgi:hypothetical protein